MNSTLDRICDEFDEALRRGAAGSLRDYLNQVQPNRRAELLNHLLQIHLEHETRQGRIPDDEAYRSEFPEFPLAIAAAFRAVRQRLPEKFAARPAEFPATPAAPRGHDDTADSVQFDSAIFLNRSSLRQRRPNAATVILDITEGPSAGKQLRYTDHQTCVLGRSKEAHLRLSPNRQFSRFHCRLQINPPDVAIVDLGSTNGTKVNGQRVETAVLTDGDEVTVGDTKFKVTIQHHPQSAGKTSISTVLNAIAARHNDQDSFDEPVPRIPGYTVERQVGHGSMGVVYVARRNATNQKVAIKIVRPLVATDGKVVEKFRREAAIVLRLQHKRIVKSLDFRLTEDLLPYLVMEYIEEVNIRELLAAATLATRCRMAAGIVVRALEGLQYAHDLEIVHRDVKPTNLLVYRSGRKLQVKLADFGLAKNFIDAGFSDCSTSNEICGTLAYMPPEQIIDCRHAKPTCDLYAAGVCLYNMISGRLPFEADMIARQISMILNAEPTPITEYVSELPPPLANVISKAMNRDVSDRYTTAKQMIHDLTPFTKRQ